MNPSARVHSDPCSVGGVPAILTIGNFDGLHRGHRELIDMTVALARSWGGRAVLITFSPHPKCFFAPREHFFIHPERIRAQILDALGLDEILCLPFAEIYRMTPREFFGNILLPLNPAAIVLGDNFTFGNNKSGNIGDLRRFCSECDIALHALSRKTCNGAPISSSRIRAAIREGDIALANEMLGAPYTLFGTVGHGARRGRTLGFPTANIRTPDQVLPLNGVYASRVSGEFCDDWREAMTAVTDTPSFGCVETVIESNLFDFSGDIYGKPIRVELHRFMRCEQKFSSKEALIRQIECDRSDILHYFRRQSDRT